jgi:hypothetical protein
MDSYHYAYSDTTTILIKDFSYNGSTYNINKSDITHLFFLFTVISETSGQLSTERSFDIRKMT